MDAKKADRGDAATTAAAGNSAVTASPGPAQSGKAGSVGRERLRPITVRFGADAWDAIRDVAQDCGVSQAELVRIAIAGNMVKYLSTLRYIDMEQGDQIKQVLVELYNAVSGTQSELHRIGVNLNQIAKQLNAEKKKDKQQPTDYRFDLYVELRKIANGQDTEEEKTEEPDETEIAAELEKTRIELERIMQRYTEATRKAGDILCRILG